MTSDSKVIELKNVQKSFKVYDSPLALLKGMFNWGNLKEKIILNDISFCVEKGETIGIMGRNGAGKSTLLKILAGTLTADGGEIFVNGRVTALLELGTGFNPEYSGRENIYMGGLCLGMSKAEIDTKIDSIIEFSELRDVIDQPFKTYSTGMQSRLTFSTAISVEPDILIIDEALSVGDAKFQAKCYQWIHSLKAKQVTVLIVSHDENTITTFCDRAIILEEGKVHSISSPLEATKIYHNILFRGGADQDLLVQNRLEPSMRYGSSVGAIYEFGLLNSKGELINRVLSGEECYLYFKFRFATQMADISGGFVIKDVKGRIVWGTTNILQYSESITVAANELIVFKVKCRMWLANGEYFVTLGLANFNTGNKVDFIEDATYFKVDGADCILDASIVNLESRLLIERAETYA